MARPKRFELLTHRFVVSRSNGGRWVLHSRLLGTAPVSHQKRPHRTTTNAIEIKRKHCKINEAGRYPAAHNGLVAGSSPAGPTSLRSLYRFAADLTRIRI